MKSLHKNVSYVVKIRKGSILAGNISAILDKSTKISCCLNVNVKMRLKMKKILIHIHFTGFDF